MELAHVSDLHLPIPWERVSWGELLLSKRLLGWLNLKLKRHHPPRIAAALAADLRARPPDHLAVTGDLTNLALPCELEGAAAWLSGLSLPPERLSVIPGNHDAYVGRAVRERWFERALGPVVGEELTWPRAQRVGELLLCSASSGVATPWFMAWGRVGPEQLARLDAQLAAPAGGKALLVHHPPLQRDGRPDRRHRVLRDGAAVLELCRRRGVDLVLCGHTHRPFRLAPEGGPRILCAGSATDPPRGAPGERATYNRYRFEGGRLRGLEVRGWDPARGEFVRLLEEEVA